MSENEAPAVLEAPITGDTDAPAAVTTPAPSAPAISPSDAIAAQVGVDAAFKAINAQPKTRIRVPKVMGPQVVIINGARFNVPANVFVEVPAQVAQVLQDAGRI